MVYEDKPTAIQTSEPQVLEQNGNKILRLATHLIGYNADDVSVLPVDNKLQLVSKDNQVLHTYDLPESVDPFTVEAQLTDDGVLIVTAPLRG